MKVIRTYSDLYQHYQHLRKFDVYHKCEKYKVKIHNWNADENDRITHIMNNYSTKSSFAASYFLMATSFLAYVVYYFLKVGSFSTISWNAILWLTMCTLGGAIMGKLLALAYARWRMIRFINRLLISKSLTEPSLNEQETICNKEELKNIKHSNSKRGFLMTRVWKVHVNTSSTGRSKTTPEATNTKAGYKN